MALARGSQAEDVALLTLKVRASSAPGFTTPVLGSLRMSDRFSSWSTKYGPSVSSGRTRQDELPLLPVLLAVESEQPKNKRAPVAPRKARASRRVRTRPTGMSSRSIVSLTWSVRLNQPVRDGHHGHAASDPALAVSGSPAAAGSGFAGPSSGCP